MIVKMLPALVIGILIGMLTHPVLGFYLGVCCIPDLEKYG